MPGRLAHRGEEGVAVELLKVTAGFAFGQGGSQRFKLSFALFEKAETGTDHIAGRAVASTFYLTVDELREVIPE